MADIDRTELFLTELGQSERRIALYVSSLIPNAADADDVLQESRLVMWRCFGQFTPGTNFGAWARRIALHQVLKYRKRTQRDGRLFCDATFEAVAADLEESLDGLEQRRKALADCVAKLPEEQRELLYRRYHEQQEIGQIAAETGRTVGAAYRLLSRVRQALHRCVSSKARRVTYELEP